MNTAAMVWGGAAIVTLAVAGGWWVWQPLLAADSDAPLTQDALPVPPRIAEGPEYERCLAMVGIDPEGARAFADAWEATGGGDGATHCRALAELALGDTNKGAESLENLAASSHGPTQARAALYGQAGQAWLVAGDPGRAYGAATLALALSPDDPDLLVDRSIASATLEHYHDAIDDLDRVLEFLPRRADALVLRAAGWRHVGQLELAEDDIDRALAIEVDNPEALLERGIVRQRQGDATGARRDWERAITLAPDTPTADLAQQNLALLEAGPERK